MVAGQQTARFHAHKIGYTSSLAEKTLNSSTKPGLSTLRLTLSTFLTPPELISQKDKASDEMLSQPQSSIAAADSALTDSAKLTPLAAKDGQNI